MSAAKDCRMSGTGAADGAAGSSAAVGLVDGGEVGVIDLGKAALPCLGALRRRGRSYGGILNDRYEVGLAAIDDADVADQRW